MSRSCHELIRSHICTYRAYMWIKKQYLRHAWPIYAHIPSQFGIYIVYAYMLYICCMLVSCIYPHMGSFHVGTRERGTSWCKMAVFALYSPKWCRVRNNNMGKTVPQNYPRSFGFLLLFCVLVSISPLVFIRAVCSGAVSSIVAL